MKTLIFHSDYIRSLMREKDVYDYNLDKHCSIKERIKQAAEILSSNTFQINVPATRKRGKSYMCHPSRWEDKLFLRHVTQRLRMIYKIRPAQRNSIVKQIRNILKSDASLTIIRTDIKGFYRSISSESILCKLDRDGFLRNQELAAISLLLCPSGNYKPQGLPWGLSISSTLAEIAMRDFDKDIWNIEGLFYYGRFVDDIIAVSPCISTLLPQINKILPTPLKLGLDKTIELSEQFTPGKPDSSQFDYLGYRFERNYTITKNGKTKIILNVTIAPTKEDRIRKRIDLSISQFALDANVTDLKGRIMMLTGNYRIRKSGHSERIPVGIYYNYRYITNASSLISLDRHLREKLISLRTAGNMTPFAKATIRNLLKFKFTEGFNNRICHRISGEKIKRFRDAWTYE